MKLSIGGQPGDQRGRKDMEYKLNNKEKSELIFYLINLFTDLQESLLIISLPKYSHLTPGPVKIAYY